MHFNDFFRYISLLFYFFSFLNVYADTNIIQNDPLPSGYKICFIGDGGSGNKNQFMVGEALAKENCNQVRYLGDIIYEKGLKNADDKQFMTKFYQPYKAMLEAKPAVQFFMVLGNHDYGQNPAAWFDIAKKYPQINIPHYYYAEYYDDICFVTLDTNDRFDEQTSWRETIKPELDKNCKISFALAHHPYLNAGEQRDEVAEKAFILKNVIGKFNFYISGHDHNLQDEGVIDGTRLLISGAGGNGLYPFEKKPVVFGNDSEYGYLVVEITRSSNVIVDYKFVTVNDTNINTVYTNKVIF